jgi:hypothetical protein
MRLPNFLTRWRKPPEPASMPAPEPRPLPLNLQVSFASFEARLNALQNDYLTLVDAVFENHSKDRIELRRREEAGDRMDEKIAQLAAEIAQLQQSSLETFQKLLKAIAEISATVDREIAKQRTTAESAPCAAQALPDGAQVLESPDPAQNLPPASGSETYSDGAPSTLPAVDDSPA